VRPPRLQAELARIALNRHLNASLSMLLQTSLLDCAAEDFEQNATEWVASLADWNCCVTVTFRWPVSVEWARGSYEKMMLGHFPDVKYFYVVENRNGMGANHIHSLWCVEGDFNSTAVWDFLFRRYGRASVRMISGREEAITYCAKYLLKEKSCPWWNVVL